VGTEQRCVAICERRLVELGATEWPLIEMYLNCCTYVRTTGANAEHSKFGSCTLIVKRLWVCLYSIEDKEQDKQRILYTCPLGRVSVTIVAVAKQ
jgi:hypothetical protein